VRAIDAGTTSTDDAGSVAEPPIAQIRSGRHHTCVRMHDGSIYCWGQGAYRALGGDYNFQGTPRLIEAFDDAITFDSGRRFGCAVRAAGEVLCWGENHSGQIAEHETIPCGDCTPLPACADSICVPSPQPMLELGDDIVELALGADHGCALRSDGAVWCWGGNDRGQVAQHDLDEVFTSPRAVPELAGVTQLTAGISHTCALVGSPGEVMCWGRNDRAQVGNGEVSDAVPSPAKVADLEDAVEIVAGGSHTCARREAGSVVCWGYNYLGSLGNGSTRPTRATSLQEVVQLSDAVALAAGEYFTCALRAGGRVVCWGDNRHGQLGDGTSEGADCSGRPCRTVPVSTMEVHDAVVLNAGHLHACAARRDGRLWCWGYNLGGQLGTGGVDRDPTPVPVEVEGLPR
jgi:alpha-tubulin suppressor-like RCC1 family protein